jgi:hypothetical protein
MQVFPSFEFRLLLKSEDLLLMNRVNESEMLVEGTAVIFDAKIEGP